MKQGSSALEFGVMVKLQVVGSDRRGFESHQTFFSDFFSFFYFPFSEHHSHFHAIRVLHDNLDFFVVSHMRI